MQKTKDFHRVVFDTSTMLKGIELFNSIAGITDLAGIRLLEVAFETELWHHNNLEEFTADYNKNFGSAHVILSNGKYELSIVVYAWENMKTQVTVGANSRQEIERVMHVFEAASSQFFRKPTEDDIEKPVVFIGHGHSSQWKDLKDHLSDKHNYKVVAYESGTRAGHTVRNVLESMMDESSFALLVMTGEDLVEDHLRARQNVIHEAGLFQGRLGFDRAIILLEEGTEEFSNIQGIEQIRFSKGKIIETYGEVLAVLKREFEKK